MTKYESRDHLEDVRSRRENNIKMDIEDGSGLGNEFSGSKKRRKFTE